MASLNDFLKSLDQVESAYLDTSVLIYHLEDRKPYSELTQLLFDFIESGRITGHISVLSVLELNVLPYQRDRPEQAILHTALLKNLPNFFIHPITLEIADRAAQLRAQYCFRTPDAIHLACAMEMKTGIIVGNDQDWKKATEVRYVHLEAFLPHRRD